MNRQALEYWFDGNDVPAIEKDWGYVIENPGTIGNDLVKEIGACGACLKTGTTGQLLIIDPEWVDE